MGILKINRGHKNDKISPLDSFLFKLRKICKKSQIRNTIFAVIIIFFSATVYQFINRTGSYEDKKPLFMFEVKAINDEGSPVAGASVFLGKKKTGLTDSFGEWRGYIRTSKGKTIWLSLKKRIEKNIFHVEKNIVVPIEDLSIKDRKIKETLQLILKNKQNLNINTNHRLADISKQYQSVWFSAFTQNKNQDGSLKKRMLISQGLIPELKRIGREQGLEINPQSPWQVSLGFINFSRQSTFPGVVRVLARKEGQEDKSDFLRNYTGNSRQMARSIIKGLKKHTPKPFLVSKENGKWLLNAGLSKFWRVSVGESVQTEGGELLKVLSRNSKRNELFNLEAFNFSSCIQQKNRACIVYKSHVPKDPPEKGWGIARMKLYGANATNSNVFIAGYKAHYEGKHIWRYWAKMGHRNFLSVIQNGNIVYRQHFDPASHQKVVTSLPTFSIANK